MSATSQRSPLHEVHAELGALFTDFAGWSMPLRYSSELAEHRGVREAAGIFDLSHMAEIEVSGPEAVWALQRAVVGDIANLAVGRAKYTMLCHVSGGVLDDLIVYRLSPDKFMVVANAANAVIVTVELQDRAHGYVATVVNRSRDIALIAVQGPHSAAIIESIAANSTTDLPYYGITSVVLNDHSVRLARTGYTGEDGFELYVPAGFAADLWRELMDAGRDYGITPAGLAARDTLRLEAGMPLYGNELSVRRTPLEAKLGRVIAFDKPGDFVGKTALLARKADGIKETLVGLRGSGRRAARRGYPVLAGETDSTNPERVIGEITSGGLSPTLGYPIALAYVPSDVSSVGTKLTVDVRGRTETVEVVKVPFYRRST